MTNLLKAEVREAMAKELEDGEFFHDGLSADLMETKDKAHAYVEGYRAAADVIRSFDLTPFQVKMPEDAAVSADWLRWQADMLECGDDKFANKARIAADLIESLAAQLADAHKKYNDALIHATKAEQHLSAQLAERDREIAELRADIDAALSLGDQLADWINKVAPCAQSMMDAYERRIRSLCETPEEIAKSPWECVEFVALRNILLRKPVAVVEAQTIKDRTDD